MMQKIANGNGNFQINLQCPGLEFCPHREDEAAQQASFTKSSGIRDCPRPAREIFQTLLAQHGFTTEALAAAWNYRALSWDAITKRMAISYFMGDHVLAWVLISLTSLLCALSALLHILTTNSHDKIGTIAIFLLSAFGLALLVYDAGIRLFRPRHVALKVMLALDSVHQGDSQNH